MSATVIFPDRYVVEASETELGLVAVDTSNGLTVTDGLLGVSTATTSRLGTVRPDGTTITVDQDGTIHGADATQVATTSIAGKVKPDGTTIMVDNDGTIHGTASSHPDWNENDPESDGYIANRPFYHHVESDILLDDHHLSIRSHEAYNEPPYEAYQNIALESDLIVGNTYTVTMSDTLNLYNGTVTIECTMGASYPMLDGYIGSKHFRVVCSSAQSNDAVDVLLYAYERSNPVAYFGDADITIERSINTLVQVPSMYLPVATDSVLGTVKYDNNTIKVNQDGQLYVNTSVRVDDSTIKVNANGELYVALQDAASVSF